MATGTGLPIPSSAPVLTQAPGGVSGDALFNADSWNKIAASGAKLADSAGDYLKVSEHKAQVGYLADQDVQIQRKQIELRDQYAYDPKGFDTAWSGYRDGKLSEAAPWAVDHVRARLGQTGNSGYSAILNETRVKSDSDAKESWGALETQSANDVYSSAMAGTLGTPEGQLKLAKYRGVVDTGVTGQFITKETADQRFGALESAATVYATRDHIKTTFDAQGPIAATKEIDGIVRDEKLKLSPDQRLTLGSRLRADMHAWDAERTQNLATVDLEAQSLLKAKQGGVPIPQARLDDVVDRYKRFGGQAQAASFLSDMQHTDDLNFLSRAPLSQSSAWVSEYQATRGFNTPRGTSEQVSALTSTASRLGIAPRDLAAAISYETGGTFNQNLIGGKGNNYAGLIQFGPEERAKYGVTPGMTFEQQMGSVEAFLRDRGVKPGMGVAEIYRTINGGNPNAPLSASDGNGTIAQHIQRIQSGHYGNADRFLGGSPPPTTVSDNTFIGKANTLVAKRVTDEADAIVKGMGDKDSPVLPSEQRINDLLASASATNSPEVLDTVARAAAEYQFRRQFGRAPEPQETGAVNALTAKARTEGLSESDARRLQIATETRDRTAKALQDDPLDHTISALSDTSGNRPPAPLNVGNPADFRAGLQARAQWAATGTRTFETAPMPALTTAESTQVRAALDAADPAGKARIYSDIVASTSGPTRSATLAKLGAKGVDGMVEAYAGAMTGMDPAIGESIIRGQAAMKAKDAFNPDKSKSDVAGSIDKYLPAGTFSLAARTDPQGAYAVMRGAVMARAADLAATDPSFRGEFPDTMIQRAVNDITGGVVTHNGAPLITPLRGMNQRGFDAKMAGLADNDLQGVTTLSGTPVTAEYVRNNAQLESLSDGRYLVRLGRDPERPVYAFRNLGVQGQPMKPFVLDMRGIAPNMNQPDPMALSSALP
jgi:hypothetical protein